MGVFGCIIPSMPPNSKLQPKGKKPRFPIGQIRIMEGFELERFILDFSVEEIRQTRALWAEYARRPDLILFEANEETIRL